MNPNLILNIFFAPHFSAFIHYTSVKGSKIHQTFFYVTPYANNNCNIDTTCCQY